MLDDASRATDPIAGVAVARILCPDGKVGGLIGKRGTFVKSIVAATGASVKVLDASAVACHERVVLIHAPRMKGESSEGCAAKRAGMMVARFLTRATSRRARDEDASHSDTESDDAEDSDDDDDEGDDDDIARASSVTLRIIVPAGQAGHLIGKGGEHIRDIRKRASGAHIAVQEVGQAPPCATSEDRVVEIQGPAAHVRVAAEAVFTLLQEFLVSQAVLTYYQPTVASAERERAAAAAAAAAAAYNAAAAAGATGVMMDPAIVSMSNSVPVPVPVPVASMPFPVRPMLRERLDVASADVSNVLGVHGSNISTIAQISGCQVSMLEADPETKTNSIEIMGPHEANLRAARQLVEAFANGQTPSVVQPPWAPQHMYPA
jgi:poly(rC)-binding protein 3/4